MILWKFDLLTMHKKEEKEKNDGLDFPSSTLFVFQLIGIFV